MSRRATGTLKFVARTRSYHGRITQGVDAFGKRIRPWVDLLTADLVEARKRLARANEEVQKARQGQGNGPLAIWNDFSADWLADRFAHGVAQASSEKSGSRSTSTRYSATSTWPTSTRS
jgi:hypothetical protein